jgi:hypothetical protein
MLLPALSLGAVLPQLLQVNAHLLKHAQMHKLNGSSHSLTVKLTPTPWYAIAVLPAAAPLPMTNLPPVTAPHQCPC